MLFASGVCLLLNYNRRRNVGWMLVVMVMIVTEVLFSSFPGASIRNKIPTFNWAVNFRRHGNTRLVSENKLVVNCESTSVPQVNDCCRTGHALHWEFDHCRPWEVLPLSQLENCSLFTAFVRSFPSIQSPDFSLALLQLFVIPSLMFYLPSMDAIQCL